MSFVRAYSSAEGNTLVTVPEAFAKNNNLHTVKDAPTDRHGRPLPPSEGYRTSAKSTAAKNTTHNGGSAASKPEEA